jgi:hypothetical protein
MSLNILARFKKKIGETGFADDSYLVQEFLNPAIERISQLVVNDYWIKVSLTGNVGEYDLTDTNIVDVSVGAGVAKVVVEDNYRYDYAYKKEFWIRNKTTLVFADKEIVSPGTFEFKYARFFSAITAVDDDDDYSEYVESDIPVELQSYVLQFAIALKRIDDIDNFSAEAGGIEEKSEANLRTKFGDVSTRRSTFTTKLKDLEKEIKKSSYGRRGHFSIPVK